MRIRQTLLQINHYLDNKKGLLWVIRGVIFLTCIGFIGYKLQGVSFEWPKMDATLILILGIVILLMPLNWYLESERWRISVPQDQLSSGEAFRVILSGLALNWAMPFTAGDAFARISPSKDWKKTAVALAVNRVVMLSITLLFGVCSVIYFFRILEAYRLVLIVSLSILLVVVGSNLLTTQHLRIMLISLFRYLIFTLQFFILFHYFNPDLGLQVILLGIGWIFLFKTALPSVFGNFGVREAGALLFFEGLTSPGAVLVPCFLIWGINQVIPSILGALAMLNLRWRMA
jgi:hypothetical protein